MNKDRAVYLQCILDCMPRIETYTQGGQEEFFHDTKTQDAVIRNIQVIGQAVKDFDVDDLLSQQNDIPCNKIAGMWNILAYQYLGVDIRLSWEVVVKHLPLLKKAIVDIAQTMRMKLTEVDPKHDC